MEVPKKKPSIFLQLLLGPICVLGLLSAMQTSMYTNIASMLARFPGTFAYPLAITNTLAIAVAQFLKQKNFFIWIVVSATITISSLLAINSISIKEITNADNRFKTDPIYQSKREYYLKTAAEYDSIQVILNNYIKLQLTTQTNWSDGSKSNRIKGDTLFIRKNRAYDDLQAYQNKLQKKGSKSNEAFVISLSSFLPWSEEGIKNFTDFMFAMIPDLQIILFSQILMLLFKDYIAIPTPRAFTRFTWSRLMFTARSLIVYQLFPKSFAKSEKTAFKSFLQIRGIRKLKELAEEHPELTQTDLGYLAAEQLGRKLKDGTVNGFTKGYVSKVVKGKYDWMLEE